jgi:hypothetical protein
MLYSAQMKLMDARTAAKIADLDIDEQLALAKVKPGDEMGRRKVSKDFADQRSDIQDSANVDKAFSANFLSCQFEIPETKGECKVTLRLKLHGDGIQLCLKDEQKTRKMNSFIDAELMPHFLKN